MPIRKFRAVNVESRMWNWQHEKNAELAARFVLLIPHSRFHIGNHEVVNIRTPQGLSVQDPRKTWKAGTKGIERVPRRARIAGS